MKTVSDNSLKLKICSRLKGARITSGYQTASEFARENDLKVSTYTLHEAGARDMSIEVIEKYAKLLDIDINWLLTGMYCNTKQKIEKSLAIMNPLHCCNRCCMN